MTKLFQAALITGGSMLAYSNSARRQEQQNAEQKVPQMKRELPTRKMNLDAFRRTEYDILIIGGGAVGAGCALDAATRGLKTALVEADDFGSGTSSKSTKLLHGGLRDLDQALTHFDAAALRRVRSSLKECSHIANMAPHLNQSVPIMLPLHHWWQAPGYWLKLQIYNMMTPGPSKGVHYINATQALEIFPMMRRRDLHGAFIYYETQHDDARMCLAIALTAARYGADVCNHMKVVELLRNKDQQIIGAKVVDQLTNKTYRIRARMVINATGPSTDTLRRLEDVKSTPSSQSVWASHLVLPAFYCPAQVGLFDPHTKNGAAIFFLPWQGHTLMGTSDELHEANDLARPSELEIQYLLGGIKNYINPNFDVRRCDVLAVWGGYKSLPVHTRLNHHVIQRGVGNMISIVGGTWTSYRLVAEEAVTKAIRIGKLHPLRDQSITASACKLDGAVGWSPNMFIRLVQDFGLDDDVAKHLTNTYGANAFKLAVGSNSSGGAYPIAGKRLHQEFPYIEAEVRQGIREYACHLVDMVARRMRVAFLNVQATEQILPRVADVMSTELNWSKSRKQRELAEARKFLSQQMGLGTKDERAKLSIPIKMSVKQVAKYAAHFKEMDEQNTGFVAINKCCAAMKSMGVKEIPVDLMHNVLRDIDCHAQGKVDLYEFLLLMSAIVHGDTAYLRYAKLYLEQKVAALGVRNKLRQTPADQTGGGL
ncbi:CG2137 [Drosophila busckii]|uniref:Glycerol-3-phosphate dehydrogenase n=1 Tax=Drosophila busckii TaxID=30019 RepID=A0A0M5J789_DROBS|nr:glycerol-3-phosphate dehydrogenase, mitochondrial [Drosophila busckii]ALC41661.1 CG2137 [Drosophila busckii]